MSKQYDRAYFDRWYRAGDIGGPARLARKVALAVATAEYHLERPLPRAHIGPGEKGQHEDPHEFREEAMAVLEEGNHVLKPARRIDRAETEGPVGEDHSRTWVLMHKLCGGKVPPLHLDAMTDEDRDILNDIKATKHKMTQLPVFALGHFAIEARQSLRKW